MFLRQSPCLIPRKLIRTSLEKDCGPILRPQPRHGLVESLLGDFWVVLKGTGAYIARQIVLTCCVALALALCDSVRHHLERSFRPLLLILTKKGFAVLVMDGGRQIGRS